MKQFGVVRVSGLRTSPTSLLVCFAVGGFLIQAAARAVAVVTAAAVVAAAVAAAGVVAVPQ